MENQRSMSKCKIRSRKHLFWHWCPIHLWWHICGGIDVGNTCNPTGIWQTSQSCACLFLQLDKSLSYTMVVWVYILIVYEQCTSSLTYLTIITNLSHRHLGSMVGRKSWLVFFVGPPSVLWLLLFCGYSSRWHGLSCSVRLLYFFIILTCFLKFLCMEIRWCLFMEAVIWNCSVRHKVI